MKSVFSGNDVELTFWAREEETAALANKSSMDLEEALSEQNLNQLHQHQLQQEIFGTIRTMINFLFTQDQHSN